MDSSRDVVQRVRTALDFYDAAQAGRNPLERRQLAEIFAEEIPGELIPALKESFLSMVAMSTQWQQKNFQAALTNAAETNTLLAGFPAATWLGWGGLLLALMEFLDTPQVGLGGITAKDALLDDYIPMTDEAWAALNPEPEPEPEPEP